MVVGQEGLLDHLLGVVDELFLPVELGPLLRVARPVDAVRRDLVAAHIQLVYGAVVGAGAEHEHCDSRRAVVLHATVMCWSDQLQHGGRCDAFLTMMMVVVVVMMIMVTMMVMMMVMKMMVIMMMTMAIMMVMMMIMVMIMIMMMMTMLMTMMTKSHNRYKHNQSSIY